MGLTYHDGRYHMFFQYVPAKILWAPQCWWGHAVSEDLLSWSEREPVLRPGDGDGGCWSGSLAVDDAGQATIFYTSVQLDDLDLGQIRSAQPDDVTWDTWQKGPFVEDIKPPSDIVVFRDPQVSRDANGWQMIVGAGRRDDTAVALSYRSPDLLNWTSEGEFASRSSAVRNPVWTGKMWECPQLIAVGSKHVLLFSVWEPQIPHYEAYAIGTVSNGQFVSERWGRLSYGDQYYAGATFIHYENLGYDFMLGDGTGGLSIFSLKNPEAPTFVGAVPASTLMQPADAHGTADTAPRFYEGENPTVDSRRKLAFLARDPRSFGIRQNAVRLSCPQFACVGARLSGRIRL